MLSRALACLLAAAPAGAQSLCSEIQLSPVDLGFAEDFKGNAALDGEFCVIATNQDGAASDPSVVHVFQRDPVTRAWTDIQQLTSPAGGQEWLFGNGLALAGDTLWVTDPLWSLNNVAAGRAAVYRWDQNQGQFLLQQVFRGTIDAPIGIGGDPIMRGDRAAMISTRVTANHPIREVEWFERDPVTGIWTYLAPFAGDVPVAWQSQHVSFDGPVLASAAIGAVHVWRQDPVSGVWNHGGELVHATQPSGGGTYYDVHVEDGEVFVGNPDSPSGGGATTSGVVSRWTWSQGTGWVEAQRLLPTDFPGPSQSSFFGFHIAVDGDLVLVGALTQSQNRGRVGVYRRDSATGLYQPEQMLERGVAGERFGWFLGMRDQRCAVGGDGMPAYIYELDLTDCDETPLPDVCEILAGTIADRNHDLISDRCQQVGTSYCAPAATNSTGAAALIFGVGHAVVAESDFNLLAVLLPPGEFGMFVAGAAQGLVPNAGGSAGTLCINPTMMLGRITASVQSSGATGELWHPLDLGAVPAGASSVALMAGDTWHFQAWYRDMGGSNFSPGLAVTFQ